MPCRGCVGPRVRAPTSRATRAKQNVDLGRGSCSIRAAGSVDELVPLLHVLYRTLNGAVEGGNATRRTRSDRRRSVPPVRVCQRGNGPVHTAALVRRIQLGGDPPDRHVYIAHQR